MSSCTMISIVLTSGLFFMASSMVFEGSAPRHKRSSDCQRVLSCGSAHELQKYDSVHVHVELKSETVVDRTFTVSSLLKGGRCLLSGDFQSGEDYVLKIYLQSKSESEPFYRKVLKPECVPEKTPAQEERSGAAILSSNTLLIILLVICFFTVFKFLSKWPSHHHTGKQLMV